MAGHEVQPAHSPVFGPDGEVFALATDGSILRLRITLPAGDMMLRKTCALLALVLMSAAASGCGAASPGDKAGGPGAGPVVLRMASTPYGLGDIATVGDFVRRVGALSGGALKVTVISQWGDYSPDAETQVVRAVAAGTVDLGWAGSRVFDSMGVPDFRALSAPMLIDSYPLENAVLAAPSRAGC